MTDTKIKSLLQERSQLLRLRYLHIKHPKMESVIKELKKAVAKIEDKLILAFPMDLMVDIIDAKNAPIEYTKRKPSEFDRRQYLKLYRHRRFVCVRQESDFHYPKNLKK